jgi:hypothetical protein
MKNACRALIAFLGAALLTACSPERTFAPLAQPAQMAAGNEHRAAGRLLVRIRIPKKRQARRVGPRYISVATKSMTMAFKGPSTFTKVINLTPSNTNCFGSPLQCTIAITLAPGKYRVTADTYDEAPVDAAIPVGANLLSTAHDVPVFITSGASNIISLTLEGAPASILVGLPTGSAGTAFSDQSFSVVVKDADGYIIVGTYSTRIVITDSDTSGATTIVTAGSDSPPPSELLSSSDTAAISYSGKPIFPATITASARTVKGSALFVVVLPVFVDDYGDSDVKEIPAGCVTESCVTILAAGAFAGPLGLAVDRSGNLFVSNRGSSPGSSYVAEIPAGCTDSGCVTDVLSGSSAVISGVAVDGSGNLFLADSGIEELPAGCTTSNCLIVLGGGFSNVHAVAVDESENVYAADDVANKVDKLPASCASSNCVATIGGGFSGPEGVAVDASGDVFVADSLNNAVKEIPPGCTTAGCVTTVGGGFNFPTGVAVDLFDNVYVSDDDSMAVKEIPSGCMNAGCVNILGGGFTAPQGIAWGL